MERNQFSRFAEKLARFGGGGADLQEFDLGANGTYRLQYAPFEHVNHRAKLVVVGITPGLTQLRIACAVAQTLLQQSKSHEEILVSIKKAAAFGGVSMRPNLLKMLRHFRFDRLLGIGDVESLWDENNNLFYSTSVVPHAAFKKGKMFAGTFDEVMKSSLLRECFTDCFVASVREMNGDALFVGLGPCPQAALHWCADNGHIRREQVLGAFCHPSSSGGSKTRYYLREVRREELNPKDPTRNQCDWLDQAYAEMQASTSRLGAGPKATDSGGVQR